jgi:uncharacterized protein (DUF58 family)
MAPEDCRRLRRGKIQLFSKIRPRNIFPGEWESTYAGDGIEFAAIRPFEPGDDLRELDLHTLVQSGEEEIIQRVVERQMRVFVWVDSSGSMRRSGEMLFSQKPEIKDIAIGLILFSACHAYSPVGLCAFDGHVRRFFPARSGERYCWEILDWIIDQADRGPAASLDVQKAVSFLVERAFPQSLVFFVSDFCDPAFEGDFDTLMRPVTERFDLVPVIIRDPLEKIGSLKRPVRIAVQDSESPQMKEAYLTPRKLIDMQDSSAAHLRALERNFRAMGIRPVVLDSPTIEDCYAVLSGYFQARRRTRG